MVKKSEPSITNLEKISFKLTSWVGTPKSIIAHSIFFIVIFSLRWVGLTLDQILLILTTAVSLEAIYLAIFIQMTVNRNTQSLEAVEDDIEDIQEDVEELGEDVEDISEDIEEDDKVDAQTKSALEHIQLGLQQLAKEIETIKKVKST